MYEPNIIENKIKKVIKNSTRKKILINGVRYTSLVSAKTLKSLYDKMYELLSKEFCQDIIKEKLKIEKNFTECETLCINLYKNSNEFYEFIPIEENNEKILYYKVMAAGAFSKCSTSMLKNNNDVFYTLEELLETFEKNEFCEIKEGKYLELKNDCIENSLYIKARDHYGMALIGTCDFCQDDLLKSSYTENNLIAASRYINELLNYDIKDNEFLTEIYNLKFNIDYPQGRDKNYEVLKKAIKINPINQNVLVTALRQMAIEFENKKSNLDFLLDYLVANINNIEVDKKSVLHKYLYSELANKMILFNINNKKFKENQLDKIIYIYETISKKMKLVEVMGYNEKELEEIDKFVTNVKAHKK